MSELAIWHDVECGAYGADLPVWEELAQAGEGPVLDLGCGTGRVALHLARRGHEVVGVDREPALVEELNRRAEGAPASAVVGDARALDLDRRDFALALAPMQLVQLLEGAGERASLLFGIAAHLRIGGTAALALVESVTPGVFSEAEAVPDSREIDGWVYASLPLETALDEERILVRRLRRTVSPAGELSRAEDRIELRVLSAATLEREAVAAGLRPAGRRTIPPTEDHVGSVVVLLRRES
ncbi:MAG TPA: class I SAM-dependent methyltransferase [Solirubrobacterales bacterium]